MHFSTPENCVVFELLWVGKIQAILYYGSEVLDYKISQSILWFSSNRCCAMLKDKRNG